MCTQCDRFLERRRVNSPYEYCHLVSQIVATVEAGTLRLLDGTCPLQEIRPPKRCPDGNIVHVLGCTNCSRRFRLSVETSHGYGGAWEVMASFSHCGEVAQFHPKSYSPHQ